MRVYPDLRAARQRTLVSDLAIVLGLVLLAWLAIKVHDEIAAVQRLGSGVVSAGTSVQQGFGTAARAVSGVPIIGGELSRGLRSAGISTGGAAVTAGRQGESDVEKVATVIGWLTFLLPSALLLERYLPGRVRPHTPNDRRPRTPA